MRAARETEKVRILPLTVAELLAGEGSDQEGRIGSKWGGLYLRAPGIYFRVLEKAGDRLVRLGNVAEVRFGIKTGANDFFHLEVLPYRPVCSLCGKEHKEALTAKGEAAHRREGKPFPEGTLVAVKNGMGWEGYLEADLLRPAIVSPKHARTYAIDPAALPSASSGSTVPPLSTRPLT